MSKKSICIDANKELDRAWAAGLTNWCNVTLNPLTGCERCSPGCKNCPMFQMHCRLHGMNKKGLLQGRNYFDPDPANVHFHPDVLNKLKKRCRKARRIFMCSMSDIFHKDVKLEWIQTIFAAMNADPLNTFMVLTKRAERLAELSPHLIWTPNIHMGVSVENRDYIHRIELLKQCGAIIKWISFEPLLGPIGRVSLSGVDWVVVGGESGIRDHSGIRPMKEEWVIPIRDKCLKMNIPFWFKDWGGDDSKENRIFQGEMYQGLPGDSKP